MQGTTHDPVTGVSYAFTPHGENLTVDCWFDPGAKLPEHYHPLQEEHWSVVEGRAKVQNGDFKGVVVPEDGAQVVRPAPSTRSRSSTSRRTCAARSTPRWGCSRSWRRAPPRPARACS